MPVTLCKLVPNALDRRGHTAAAGIGGNFRAPDLSRPGVNPVRRTIDVVPVGNPIRLASEVKSRNVSVL